MKNKLKVFVITLFITAFVFGTCDSGGGGGKSGGGANGGGNSGILTITIGSGNSRAVYTDDQIKDIEHEVTVTDSESKTQNVTIPAGGGTARFTSLALGNCTVIVEGYLNNVLVSYAETTGNIRSGTDNTVSLKMGPVYTVTFMDDGKIISKQIVKEDEKASSPANPTKTYTLTAGLYEGTLDKTTIQMIFVDWYNENSKYDFNTPVTKNITLNAKWDDVLTPVLEGNDLTIALEYITSYYPGEYTMLLSENVTIDGDRYLSGGSMLTIIGLGNNTSLISNAYDTPIFTITNASLILGDKITLTSNNVMFAMTAVRITAGGNLTMKTGSKINNIGTGDNPSVGIGYLIMVNGEYSTFIMEGGTITGNNCSGNYGSVVYLEKGGSFYMSDGTINGNTANYAVFIDDSGGAYVNNGGVIKGEIEDLRP
jgi:hypothetical protein